MSLLLASSIFQVLFRIAGVLADPAPTSASAPLVALDYGTFQGFCSTEYTQSFLGIPFAEPPMGKLRFNNPVAPQMISGIRNASWYGDSCPQLPLLSPNESLPDNPGLNGVGPYLAELLPRTVVANSSEDCLYINVVKPTNSSSEADLPVVVWIYGGGFEYSDASSYNGIPVVSRSLSLKSPVVFVSFNYRSNAFGFIGGREVKAAGLGNFGLHDQRFALQWVQKYIYRFGGDPKRVIVWGQSAGAMSIMLQMVSKGGQLDGLFRGAVMLSGATPLIQNITSQSVQDKYDFLVKQTNCTSANDTLECLRQAPYSSLLNAVQKTPSLLSNQSLSSSWKPQVDGIFLNCSARESLRHGSYAHIPAILANVDDEGTLFSIFDLNVTTDEQFGEYIQTNFLIGATRDEIQQLEKVYPTDPSLGSPYGVGTNDTLTPEYKRIASFQGDFYFQVPRRYALGHLSRTQDVWSYLWKRGKYIPGLGSFHTSDLQEFYNLTEASEWVGTDALINFAYSLDPNVPKNGYPLGSAPSLLTNVTWPQYKTNSSTGSQQLLTFVDPDVITLTNDTFRVDAFNFLDEMQDKMGL